MKKMIVLFALSVITIVCVVILVFVLTRPSQSAPVYTGQIKVGDYVTFGSYYDEPILWRCVDTENGVELWSEHIICMKAYDAAESGIWGESGGNYSTDLGAQQYGNRDWKTSNIREWLNSDATVVKYSTQPPVQEAVQNGENPYADEAGFLTNFTESERDLLLPVLHEDSTDLVYIMSFDEICQGGGGTDPMRNAEYLKLLTDVAKENSDYDKSFSSNTDWWYYGRHMIAKNDAGENLISTYGAGSYYYYYHVFYGVYPCAGNGGVAPALTLKSDRCTSGDGTIKHPWVLG